MAISTKDQQALDDLYLNYKNKHGGAKEDYFAALYLKKKFGVEIEEVSHQIAFGGNDYGLDAYYISHQKNLYLYQFKWTESHDQFKGSMVRLAEDGLKRLFGNPKQDRFQNDLLSYFKKDLKEARAGLEHVYIHFVFKGDLESTDKSEGLANRREDLEGKAHFINEYFNREVELEVDFIADKPGNRGVPPRQTYDLSISKSISLLHPLANMRVGFIPLFELHEIYVALRDQMFDRNIRGALSQDNAPNRKILDALEKIVLKESDDPSVFSFRHNGVSLAAEKVSEVDGRLRLHLPRLLNGAQTISTCARFLEKHADNALLKKNRDRFNSIMVMGKIIEADPASDFVTQITISNNQQNPVPPWALRAMDRRQVDLADKFRDEHQIFYSRQEGVFDNLSDEDKEELGIEDSRDIGIRQLAQTLLAVQGDVYNMGHLPDVFESQSIYEKTFRPTYLQSDGRAIILAYKVGMMIRRAMRKLDDIVPEKHKSAIPKSRNLVWALLIQAMLNDKNYKQHLELYGCNLRKDSAFGELLQKLITSKIWPLLKDLFALSLYKDKVSNQKYDFLRTAEVFQRSMHIASTKFDWQRQTF